MSGFKGKCKVLIDFPTDSIIQTRKKLGATLKAFNRCLDQVSTISLCFVFQHLKLDSRDYQL